MTIIPFPERRREDGDISPQGTPPHVAARPVDANGFQARRKKHRYAELHMHSAYSFLDGANEPEDLIAAGVALGIEAMALTDHDGMPGVVKHASAGRRHGMPTIFGAELTMSDGSHLPVLARGPEGYRDLVSEISRYNLDKGKRTTPAHTLAALAKAVKNNADASSTCLVLTGGIRGPVRRALGDVHDPTHWNLKRARKTLGELVDYFGKDAIGVELTLDGSPADACLTTVLSQLADEYRLPLIATGSVRCATPIDAHLADVLNATRLQRDLEAARAYMPPVGRWLRDAQSMAYLHRWKTETVDVTADIAADLAFDLRLVAPDLPAVEVPAGHTTDTWLHVLVEQGAVTRYGSRVKNPRAWEIIDHEMAIIQSLRFSGYFLIVRSIVDFCEKQGILCQGRGSAANSAVCYALGITAVDAVRHRMLFERFLSPGRQGYPDIDLDIEACRREEVIQYVYSHYGRHYAAQVANVISYRPRSAIRDAARALGYPTGLQDAWARSIEHGWTRSDLAITNKVIDGPDNVEEIPQEVLDIADRLLLLPRHLGIHSGGMVLTHTPVTQICPVQWASKSGRTVLQWDKDDCAEAGLVKFDLLGLGMLTALRLAFTTLNQRHGRERNGQQQVSKQHGHNGEWGLHTLPEDDPAVYQLLQAADTIGVFQVESRAQMATLPRLAPRCFYDIVVEVALIRPGPIQGDAVNPYIRRRLGQEPVTYLHESLKPALEKTLGVPLFQEQLMQIAIDAAGFTAQEADALRQAMGAKRSLTRMEALHARLVQGMEDNGIPRNVAETIFEKLRAFAEFGFPESHAFSFAYLVYASAWLKVRHPEDFYAGILAAQPMGFWSPQSLVSDAQRHGVCVLAADINASMEKASVEEIEASGKEHMPASLAPCAPVSLDVDPSLAVRLGLGDIKGIGQQVAQAIVEERAKHGPFSDIADLAYRLQLTQHQLESLALSGALESLGIGRREAAWSAASLAGKIKKSKKRFAASDTKPSQAWYQPLLPYGSSHIRFPSLKTMTPLETHRADIGATGLSVAAHPMSFVRDALDVMGVVPIAQVMSYDNGMRIRTAGLVTHRQRPHTASGIVFLNLEDETGLLNIICARTMWHKFRIVGRTASALIVRGKVEKADGVVAVRADRLEILPGTKGAASYDWR